MTDVDVAAACSLGVNESGDGVACTNNCSLSVAGSSSAATRCAAVNASGEQTIGRPFGSAEDGAGSLDDADGGSSSDVAKAGPISGDVTEGVIMDVDEDVNTDVNTFIDTDINTFVDTDVNTFVNADAGVLSSVHVSPGLSEMSTQTPHDDDDDDDDFGSEFAAPEPPQCSIPIPTVRDSGFVTPGPQIPQIPQCGYSIASAVDPMLAIVADPRLEFASPNLQVDPYFGSGFATPDPIPVVSPPLTCVLPQTTLLMVTVPNLVVSSMVSMCNPWLLDPFLAPPTGVPLLLPGGQSDALYQTHPYLSVAAVTTATVVVAGADLASPLAAGGALQLTAPTAAKGRAEGRLQITDCVSTAAFSPPARHVVSSSSTRMFVCPTYLRSIVTVPPRRITLPTAVVQSSASRANTVSVQYRLARLPATVVQSTASRANTVSVQYRHAPLPAAVVQSTASRAITVSVQSRSAPLPTTVVQSTASRANTVSVQYRLARLPAAAVQSSASRANTVSVQSRLSPLPAAVVQSTASRANTVSVQYHPARLPGVVVQSTVSGANAVSVQYRLALLPTAAVQSTASRANTVSVQYRLARLPTVVVQSTASRTNTVSVRYRLALLPTAAVQSTASSVTAASVQSRPAPLPPAAVQSTASVAVATGVSSPHVFARPRRVASRPARSADGPRDVDSKRPRRVRAEPHEPRRAFAEPNRVFVRPRPVGARVSQAAVCAPLTAGVVWGERCAPPLPTLYPLPPPVMSPAVFTRSDKVLSFFSTLRFRLFRFYRCCL